MTEQIENLILEHLRVIRADQSVMRHDLRDIKMRLAALESYQAAGHTDSARQSARIDELDERVQRIERRLDLREEPTS